MNEIRIDKDFEERIKSRIHKTFSEWRPGYQDWLNWSKGLYAPDALIKGMVSEPILFSEYRASMKEFRDSFDMELGPFDIVIAEGDTVAVSYPMYMTHKADYRGIHATGKRLKIPTMEFNKFKADPDGGEPMVIELWIAAGGIFEQLVPMDVLEKVLKNL